MCGLCLSCGGGLVVSGIGNVASGIGYQRLGVVVLKFGFIPWTKLGFGWGGRGGQFGLVVGVVGVGSWSE